MPQLLLAGVDAQAAAQCVRLLDHQAAQGARGVRVSVDPRLRGGQDGDQIGIIDGFRSTFGKSYVGEPDRLVEQLKADAAVMESDTLMLTIPNQLGVEYCAHVLEALLTDVAPALGWR